MSRLSILLLAASCLGPAALWAAPPMKVIYSEKVSTKFTWHWPQHTVRTYTTTQTKPYFYVKRLLNLDANTDIRTLRFHYPDLVSKREWGYYFEPGTHLYNSQSGPLFGKPGPWVETIQNK
jgi:hypothetical protein